MKKTTRMLSIALVLCLMLSMAMPGFAAQLITIETWTWMENTKLRNGVLYLAPMHYMESDIVLRLPGTILINDNQPLDVSWDCPDFPAKGVSWGKYDFFAVLPEDTVLDEDAQPIKVRVIITAPAQEPEAAASPAPAPAAPDEPSVRTQQVTEENPDGTTTTTTTITYPDGTEDIIEITRDENDKPTQVTETRRFNDGYYTVDNYTYNYDPAKNPDPNYAYHVINYVSEGFENTASPTDSSKTLRTISHNRLDYDQNGRLMHTKVAPLPQDSDDPANPAYYNSQTPSPHNIHTYYSYDGDTTTVEKITTQIVEDEMTTPVIVSQSEETFQYNSENQLISTKTTTDGVNTTQQAYTYDDQGRILTTTTTEGGVTTVATRSYVNDENDFTETVTQDDKLLKSSDINGTTGRVVSSTEFNADGTPAKKTEFKTDENGTYKQITEYNPDASYSVTRYIITDSATGTGQYIATNYDQDGNVITQKKMMMSFPVFSDPGVENPPAEPGTPSDTGTPTEPGAPTDTGNPTEPGAPADTGTPTDTGAPTDTGIPTEPGTPSDTGTPTEPGEPTGEETNP